MRRNSAALRFDRRTLDRIIKNETYMHAARVRASEIAEYIRKGPPPAQ
jgi:hypothetical protein